MKNEGPNGKKGKLSQIWIRPNMALGKSQFFLALKLGLYGGRRDEKKRRREEIQVWKLILVGLEHLLCLELVWNCLEFDIETTINLSLSKLCRKNPIRSVVGWYKMSIMVYFEFWLSWFWFGRKFLVKRAKFGYFCIILDTPMPRRRSAHLGIELRLGGGHYT